MKWWKKLTELDELMQPADSQLEGGALFLGLGVPFSHAWDNERYVGRPSSYMKKEDDAKMRNGSA